MMKSGVVWMVLAFAVGLASGGCAAEDAAVPYTPLASADKADGGWDAAPVTFDAACDSGARLLMAVAGDVSARGSLAALAQAFDDADIALVGAGSDTEQAASLGALPAIADGGPRVISVDGFEIGWVACGEAGADCVDDQAEVAEAIAAARSADSVDIVVVSMRAGEAGQVEPTALQQATARAFADAGASIILGTGSEVVQPWEKLTAADGREVLVIYSLGDAGGGQHLSRRALAAGFVGLTRTEAGVVVNGLRYIPLAVDAEGGVSFADDAPDASARNLTVSSLGVWNQHRRDQPLDTTPQCAADWSAPHVVDGWIGGACASDLACGGAICDGAYPEGLCTVPCARFCPDRGGRSETFCITGGDATGRCVVRCDDDRDCRDGWRCRLEPRHNEPEVERTVCVPSETVDPVGGEDPDTAAVCGNETIEEGETCDPPGSCAQTCDDADACTVDARSGGPSTCDMVCSHAPVVRCEGGDGCCPAGCTAAEDDDCGATCDAAVCGLDDGCCAPGCDVTNDDDCVLDCRDASTWPAAWVQYEAEVLELTNARRAEGATCWPGHAYRPMDPLVHDDRLRESARCHALDMAVNAYFSHTGLDGSDHGDRISRTGYEWIQVSENIAAGHRTPTQVVDGWMASEQGHCDGIMDALVTELGVGFVLEPDNVYKRLWVQHFGLPRR